MENEITNSTQEVDTLGGWLITHWTKTWDTRTPLTQISVEVDNAQKAFDDAQAKLIEIQAKQAQYQKEISDAIAAKEAKAAADLADKLARDGK